MVTGSQSRVWSGPQACLSQVPYNAAAAAAGPMYRVCSLDCSLGQWLTVPSDGRLWEEFLCLCLTCRGQMLPLPCEPAKWPSHYEVDRHHKIHLHRLWTPLLHPRPFPRSCKSSKVRSGELPWILTRAASRRLWFICHSSTWRSSAICCVLKYISRKHCQKELQSFFHCSSFDHLDLQSLNDYIFVFLWCTD